MPRKQIGGFAIKEEKTEYKKEHGLFMEISKMREDIISELGIK